MKLPEPVHETLGTKSHVNFLAVITVGFFVFT